jgi:hypothetical protein
MRALGRLFGGLVVSLVLCGCNQQQMIQDADLPNRPPPRLSEGLWVGKGADSYDLRGTMFGR